MSLVRNQTRKEYSFKSVGSKLQLRTDEAAEIKKPPIGIKTPLRLNKEYGLFDMHTDMGKQISDNLRNLLLTNHGERLGFFDYGANLGPLVFELGSEEADEEAINRISFAVKKYMPFVELDGFQVFIDHFDNKEVAKVGIRVTYLIPNLDQLGRSLEVMLYIGG